VVAVTMRAEAAKPRATQGGLYSPPTPEPEKLELTLARIAAIVGAGNVGAPELVDTHRPGAFRLRALHPGKPAAAPAGATLALRRYRPPLPARVQAAEGRPARISARGVEGIVLTLAGPWRTSGDWWTPDPWARDEWDVALSDGALYRIYFERTAGRWFVEASYD
jgi:protein ImuB